MTYRQLAAEIEQIEIWVEALLDLKSTFPSRGTAEQKDAHQALINTVENALDQEIEE